MSSLLDQAIVDAKLLRDSSMKRAEETILEQYKEEIKKYTNMLLEQDDAGADPLAGGDTAGMDLGGAPDMSAGAGVSAEASPATQKFVKDIPAAYLGEDNLQEIEINLDSIVEKIDALQKDLNVKSVPSFDQPAHNAVEQGNQSQLPPDALAEAVNEEKLEEEAEESVNNELESRVTEEDLEEEYQLDEEIVMDMANVDPGGISNEIELKKQVEVSKALEAQNEDLQEQLNSKAQELDLMEEKLQGMLAKLQETKGKLKKSVELNVKLKEGFEMLTKKAGEINLLNARLLYTNKVLGNTSMNERQKKQIAESISKSKSVEEAKTIYETLQKSAQTNVERRQVPQSLTEAVSRASSPFLPRARETNVDPLADRWQRIAGIKK